MLIATVCLDSGLSIGTGPFFNMPYVISLNFLTGLYKGLFYRAFDTFTPLNISRFPGGPGKRSIEKPTETRFLRTIPLAQ